VLVLDKPQNALAEPLLRQVIVTTQRNHPLPALEMVAVASVPACVTVPEDKSKIAKSSVPNRNEFELKVKKRSVPFA
jgi:hypothetical protein